MVIIHSPSNANSRRNRSIENFSCQIYLSKQYKMNTYDAMDIDRIAPRSYNQRYLPPEVMIRVVSFLRPEEYMQLTAVCRDWNTCFKTNMDWHAITIRLFGDLGISSLENLRSVAILPTKIWYQEYIRKYAALKDRCSFCLKPAVYTGK